MTNETLRTIHAGFRSRSEIFVVDSQVIDTVASVIETVCATEV